MGSGVSSWRRGDRCRRRPRRTYTFSGFPLSNAAEQSGAIGITQSANLWVNVTTAQGLRRIDPRELPTDLRANPGTSSAYQFLDQPFKLNFAVESSPPLYRAEATDPAGPRRGHGPVKHLHRGPARSGPPLRDPGRRPSRSSPALGGPCRAGGIGHSDAGAGAGRR